MRKTVLLLTMLCSLVTVGADTEVETRVALVADFSFSMAVRYDQSGSAPYSLIPGLFTRIAARSPEGTGWALIAFDDVEAVSVKAPFGTTNRKIAQTLQDMEPWARSPLQESIDLATEYLVEFGEDNRLILWIVSDYLATDPDPLAIPSLSLPVDHNVRIVVTSPGLPDNPGLEQDIQASVEAAGGVYLRFGEQRQILSALFSDHDEAAVAPFLSGAESDESDEPDLQITHEIHNGAQPYNERDLPLSLLLLIPSAVLAVLSYRALVGFLDGSTNASVPAEVKTSAGLIVLHPDGTRTGHRITRFPVRIGADSGCDIVLDDVRIRAQRARSGFKIESDGADAFFTSPLKILVNGVALKNKKLHVHDRIHYGKYRVLYLGLKHENHELPVRGRPTFLWPLAASVTCIILTFLLWNPSTFKLRRRIPSEPVQNVVVADEIETDTGSEQEVHPPIGVSDMVIVGPDDELPELHVDILCIHAHPDDETLDFGSLIAAASGAGLSVGVVLFTDGEGGIDQYPRRITNDLYPPYDLSGKALARNRVREAASALQLLDASVYIRYGLPNNPYNSSRDVLSPNSVISRWGGRGATVERVASAIRTLSPDLIVSPDRRSGAYEHFEHEAVGAIVAEAIAGLRSEGGFRSGHIVSVDPLQRTAYRNLVALDAMATSARERQISALKKYLTQRDADVIGAEILPRFGSEYYVIREWDLPVLPEHYFISLK